MKNRRAMGTCLGCAVGSLLAGCTYQSVKVTPLNQSHTAGIAYALPRTVLKVTVPYSVDVTTVTRFGVETRSESDAALITKPIVVEQILSADTSTMFVLETTKLSKDIFLKADVTYNLDDSGMLQCVDGSVEDESLDSVTAFSSTALDVVKFLARGAGEENPVAADAAVKIDAAYAQLMGLSDAKSDPADENSRQAKILALRKKIEYLKGVVAEINEGTKTSKSLIEASFSVTLDPEKLTPVSDDCLEYTIKPGKLFTDIEEKNMPVVRVRIHDEGARTNVNFIKTHADDLGREGIVYRPPRSLLTEIFVGSEPVARLSQYMSYPQFATPSTVPVDSKAFTDKSSKLVFSGRTGMLTEYSMHSKSSAANIAKAIDAGVKAGTDARDTLDARNSASAQIQRLSDQTSLKVAKDDAQLKLAQQRVQQETQMMQVQQSQQQADLAAAQAKLDAINQQKTLLDLQAKVQAAQKALDQQRSDMQKPQPATSTSPAAGTQ